ncbi:MAG: hypothetical protein H6732_12625 [Alphaproteobacteria bacterium]|nr:hypothetical protein [Alphaproteobacteria bacterium]
MPDLARRLAPPEPAALLDDPALQTCPVPLPPRHTGLLGQLCDHDTVLGQGAELLFGPIGMGVAAVGSVAGEVTRAPEVGARALGDHAAHAPRAGQAAGWAGLALSGLSAAREVACAPEGARGRKVAEEAAAFGASSLAAAVCGPIGARAGGAAGTAVAGPVGSVVGGAAGAMGAATACASWLDEPARAFGGALHDAVTGAPAGLARLSELEVHEAERLADLGR